MQKDYPFFFTSNQIDRRFCSGKTARGSAASPASRSELTHEITGEQHRHAAFRKCSLRQGQKQNTQDKKDIASHSTFYLHGSFFREFG